MRVEKLYGEAVESLNNWIEGQVVRVTFRNILTFTETRIQGEITFVNKEREQGRRQVFAVLEPTTTNWGDRALIAAKDGLVPIVLVHVGDEATAGGDLRATTVIDDT